MQMREILYHIRYRLKNPQAAKSVKKDLNETKEKLSLVAESIKLCDEPELKKYEYRVIFFQRHRYVMLYRVSGETVYVDGIYHELQNYQNLFR